MSAALSKINADTGGEETENSILAHSVYEGERVVVVISTGQKFTIWWDEIEGAGLPEATIKQ